MVNRINESGPHVPQGPHWRFQRKAAVRWSKPDADAVFAPLHYESNYDYPLVVWLHSEEASSQQLRRVMPQVSTRNYVGVAPSVGEGSGVWSQDAGAIERADEAITRCISQVKRRFSVSRNRIFLAGAGTGGTMALRLALRYPGRFTGVLSLGGALPRGHAPLVHLDAARHLPIFLACNASHDIYPAEQVCRDIRLLHSAGLVTTLRHYSCEESLPKAMLADVDRWIMDVLAVDGSTNIISGESMHS